MCSVISARSAAASVGSMAFALPPRGFRVKNANVFAPMESAVSPMARKPFDVDRWHPMVSISTLSSL